MKFDLYQSSKKSLRNGICSILISIRYFHEFLNRGAYRATETQADNKAIMQRNWRNLLFGIWRIENSKYIQLPSSVQFIYIYAAKIFNILLILTRFIVSCAREVLPEFSRYLVTGIQKDSKSRALELMKMISYSINRTLTKYQCSEDQYLDYYYKTTII